MPEQTDPTLDAYNSAAMKPIVDRLNDKTPVIDAAVELCAFCRLNSYPREGTADFFLMTQLIDKLDSELRKRGLIAQTLRHNDKVSRGGE